MMAFNIGDLMPNTPHLFADIAELMVLMNLTGNYDLHRDQLVSISRQGTLSVADIDFDAFDEARESGEELQSREKSQLEDVWTQLEFREKFFGYFYPFEVQGNSIKIKGNVSRLCDSLPPEQRLYCFLLSCSRLRSFENYTSANLWPKFFTLLCKSALQTLSSDCFNTKIFDADSSDRYSYYGTNLRDALPVLGRDLGVIQVYHRNINKLHHRGDAGFDLVSVMNFGDGTTTNFAILGQCGAQEKNWPDKTLEAHSFNLQHLFHTNFIFPSVMFTPVCYRDSDGTWVDEKPTNQVVLLDRKRILHLLHHGNHVENIVNSTWFTNYEINFELVQPERD
jgi:hypothetical protein